MHPPVFHVDHRHHSHSTHLRPARSVPKRGAPQRLDLALPSPGFPPVWFDQPMDQAYAEAQRAIDLGLAAPRMTLRTRLGLGLIRLGQLLIGPQAS